MRPFQKFLFLGLILTSCSDDFFDQIVEVEIPAIPTRVVLNGQVFKDSSISPGLPRVYVEVSRTIHPLSNEFPNTEKGSKVNLFVNGVFQETLTLGHIYPGSREDTTFYYYSPTYNPTPGDSYRIEVIHPELPTVHSDLVLPKEPSQYSAIYSDKVNRKVKITLQASTNEAYFSLDVYDQGGNAMYFSSSDPSIELLGSSDDLDGPSLGKGAVITNKLFGNKVHAFEITLDYLSPSVSVRLSAITKDTYLYLKSQDAMGEEGGSPFSQPINLHSNVTDGLGFIGGFNSKTTILP